MASSDFSSAYMLGVRLLPSRAGPAQVRARVRPPRFRAKNFSTCTRSPTARGSSHASQYAMGRCCLLFSGMRSAPRNSTRFAAQYLARGLPCERFTAALASRTSCITRGRGGWLNLPRGGLPPPILCQLPGALCHGSIRTIVEHYGGFLAKYATDGIVVYFGYPQAHEDDAERAVRTALAVIEAVAKLKIGCLTEPLQPRVGVATGVVLVGDSIMDGPTTVAGEAAHVAARLLTLA